MKYRQSKPVLKYFDIFIKILLFLSLSSFSQANENKIGSVTEINGTIVAINEELDERDLSIHDPIFVNEEIFVTEGSSTTIQFEDNTAIIMKEFTSLNVSEFENSKLNPKIKAKLLKGKIVIESGSIAKNINGEMLIDVSTTSLGLRGTRVDININSSGKSAISLSEDSFGNIGELKVSSGGETSTISSPEQVIEVSENNEIDTREKTNQEKEEEKTVTETLIKSSKINEIEIEQQLQKKLEEGKLQDANNDGVVDKLDIKVTKDQITEEKKLKIDFIVKNSEDENTDFLSDVIDQSDDKNTGEVIEKIIDTKDNLVEGVVENLSDKDNKFLTTTTSEGADLIKEKIFETIVSKETDKSAEILSKVMAKADTTTINSVINNVTEKNTNIESKLSLKVMADFSEKNPDKLETLSKTNSDQIDKLTVSAVEEASTSNEDTKLIAKVVAVASDELVNKVVEEVSKNNTTEKQDLSAKVLKAIVETQSGKIDIINDEIKDIVIRQTVEAVKTQQETETNIAIENDLTDVVAEIIVNSDNNTASKLIEEINQIDTETNLSLKVISGISEKDSAKLNELSNNNKEQMDELTTDAVQKAENTSEDSQLIANVVAVVNDDLVNFMIEEVSKISINEKQTLSAKVLQKIVENEPDKFEIINDEVKDVMIKQTVESAKNQKEGTGIQEEENFTDIVSEIIVNTNTETASKVIEQINEVDTETNLSLEVISGISEKDSAKLNELSNNNKEQMDELTTDAVQKAENTSEDSQLIANVVAVVNDDLVNFMIEEVSKTAIDEKQSLSAKVLKAIVDTEPSKIENINEETKSTIIKQTLEAAKNQEEGQILDEEDLSNVVADIVVKTDANTANQIIEGVNNTETDSSLSLKVIAGISEKDANKINELAEANKENIERLTEKAVQSAESTSEDSELIAQVVAVASDEIVNKVVEEVTKNSTDEKQTLSAKVMKSIVESNPDKVEALSSKNKETIIDQTIDAAKSQAEGSSKDNTDLSKTVAEIIVKSTNSTATEVLASLEEAVEETSSKLALNVVDNLSKQRNYEQKLEIVTTTSIDADQSVNKILENAIKSSEDDTDYDKLINIIEKSTGTVSNKIIDSRNKDRELNDKVNQIMNDIIDTNPEKSIEIFEKNKDLNKTVKNDVEDDKVTTLEEVKKVFDRNVTPN